MTNEHCFKQRPTCSVFLCDLCNLYNHILTERLRSFKCYSFSYIRENKALISLQFGQSFGKYPDRNSIWVSEKAFLHHIMNPMCTVYRKMNWILTCKHYNTASQIGCCSHRQHSSHSELQKGFPSILINPLSILAAFFSRLSHLHQKSATH